MSGQFPPGGPENARVCTNCYSSVPYGVPICPNCNSIMPVSPPTYMPPSTYTPPPGYVPPLGSPPKKSNTRLIVGVLLVVVIVVAAVSLGGYFVFVNSQQMIDKAAALQAPNKLQTTCLTATVDNSTLRWSGYAYSGYERAIDTLGVSNPTSYPMDIDLTFTLAYPRVNWNLVSPSPTFHLAPNNIGYAHFTFIISASQLNSLPANPDFSGATATLDGTYSVTGTYGTYSVTQHQTVAVSSSSSNTLPAC